LIEDHPAQPSVVKRFDECLHAFNEPCNAAPQFVTTRRTDVFLPPSTCASNAAIAVAKPSTEAEQQSTAKRLHARVAQNADAGACPSTLAGFAGFESLRPFRSRGWLFFDLEHAALAAKADLAQLGRLPRRPAYAEVRSHC